MQDDSAQYQQKKRFFDSLLTIYGRKPVLEALQNPQLDIYKLHLADSNKRSGIIADIIASAEQRNIAIAYHERKALSRISRNGKQDQGVAADIALTNYQTTEQFLAKRDRSQPFRLIALDSVTNPQNLGMIIRSVAAGYIDGLIVPQQGCAPLSPLVIKASAGTLFKAPIIYSKTLPAALDSLAGDDTEVCILSSHAKQSLFDYRPAGNCIFILGNETEGVSPAIIKQANQQLAIPMNNGVESLNVAITAALIAFQHY